MEILNINFENKTVREYDNMGAHNAAKLMMNKYENLTIQFKTGKDNFPYAWLESRSMAGFKLILNQKELIWLMGYLKEGKTEDFGTEVVGSVGSDDQTGGESITAKRKRDLTGRGCTGIER